MNYLLLIFVVIISIKIIQKSKYFFLINSLILLIKKATKVILNNKISDHWKEKIIPEYSYRMISLSLPIMLIILIIFSVIFLADKFHDDFLNFIISFKGIVRSLLVAVAYLYIHKSLLGNE